MFVLGLILILLSAGALVAVLASGTGDEAALYGGSVNLPTLVVFLAGAAALLLFIMGLELVRSGLKKANKTRKNNRRLRKLEKREEARSTETADPATSSERTSGPTDTSSAPGGTRSERERGGTAPYEDPPPAS